MNAEQRATLDNIAGVIASYTHKMQTISDLCEMERAACLCNEDGIGNPAALKISIDYAEIIGDYLRLLQAKSDELTDFVNDSYRQSREQQGSKNE